MKSVIEWRQRESISKSKEVVEFEFDEFDGFDEFNEWTRMDPGPGGLAEDLRFVVRG